MSFDEYAREAARAATRDAQQTPFFSISIVRKSRKRRMAVMIGTLGLLGTLTIAAAGQLLSSGSGAGANRPVAGTRVSSPTDPTRLIGTLESEAAPYQADGADGGCGIDNMPSGWQQNAVKVGPLWLWNVASPTGDSSTDRFTQTIAILEPGVPVTLAVTDANRGRVSHLFDPTTWNQGGRYLINDGGIAVTFLPCDAEPAQFVGGFVFRGVSCAEFDVTIGDSDPTVTVVSVPFTSDPCA